MKKRLIALTIAGWLLPPSGSVLAQETFDVRDRCNKSLNSFGYLWQDFRQYSKKPGSTTTGLLRRIQTMRNDLNTRVKILCSDNSKVLVIVNHTEDILDQAEANPGYYLRIRTERAYKQEWCDMIQKRVQEGGSTKDSIGHIADHYGCTIKWESNDG